MDNENIEGTNGENEERSCTQIVPIRRPTYRKTISTLITCYQVDPVSNYPKLRWSTKNHYDACMKRLRLDIGTFQLSEIRYRNVLEWHELWKQRGETMAHSLVAMLRTLISYGTTLLDCDDCAKLGLILSKTRFKMGEPRSIHLTAEQANLVRKTAREKGWLSIALAQAFQFDCILRQKDVIGEWVPRSFAGPAVIDHPQHGKWGRGLLWEEIDSNWVLEHVTSKRQKKITVPLIAAPMVMSELKAQGLLDNRPATGPVIVSDLTHLPFKAVEYRRRWREIARAAQIPDEVRNMDSRAGAITEATEAGIPLESIRHAATHSDISMTQRYARNAEEKTASVMEQRAAHRAANGEG